MIICFVISISSWSEILEPKGGVALKLASNWVKSVCSWVPILDVLAICYFSKRVIALPWRSSKPYFLTCSLRVLVNAYALLLFDDGLWGHRKIIFAKVPFCLRLILAIFIIAKINVRFISIGFGLIISIICLIKFTKWLKACLVIIFMVVGILELIDVPNVREVFAIEEPFLF